MLLTKKGFLLSTHLARANNNTSQSTSMNSKHIICISLLSSLEQPYMLGLYYYPHIAGGWGLGTEPERAPPGVFGAEGGFEPGTLGFIAQSLHPSLLHQLPPHPQHSNHSFPFQSSQDVARLIVERSTIMSHLFSKLSYCSESDAVLVALLSIFSRYIKRMRQSKEGDEVYSWVGSIPFPPFHSRTLIKIKYCSLSYVTTGLQ